MIKKKEKNKLFENSLCCAAQKYYPNNKFTNSKIKENLTQSINFTPKKRSPVLKRFESKLIYELNYLVTPSNSSYECYQN